MPSSGPATFAFSACDSVPNRQSDTLWYHLLPYVEQNPTFTQGTKANPVVNSDGYIHKVAVREVAPVVVPVFLCASDDTNGAHTADPTTSGYGAVNLPGTGGPITQWATGSYVGNVMVLDPSIPRSIVGAMPDGSSNTAMIGHRVEKCDARVVWGVTFDIYNFIYAEPRNFSPYRSMAIFGMPTYYNTYGNTTNVGGVLGSNVTQRNSRGVRNQNQDFTLGGLPFQIQPRAGFCQPFSMVSTHPVMIIALGDGSVRTVSDSISATTWRNAWTPADGNTLGADWN